MRAWLALLLPLAPGCFDLSRCDSEDEIALSELPAAVTDAIEGEWPGSTVLAAEREEEDGEVEYEVEIETADGERLEVELLADGTIEEWERAAAADDDDDGHCEHGGDDD